MNINTRPRAHKTVQHVDQIGASIEYNKKDHPFYSHFVYIEKKNCSKSDELKCDILCFLFLGVFK